MTSAPLLKWPGGKRKLVESILPVMPESFGSYFEPFFGGGALFFAIKPKRSLLSDKNVELMRAYSQVRDEPEAVIKALRGMRNSESDYYRIRSSRPKGEVACAARLIYLTTLAFNGIYRVNLNGEFNVPYGQKKHLVPCDEVRIREASRLLAGATLAHDDFESALGKATKGDLVYLDPPYTVAHQNNGFIKYNAKIFSWDDQVRLADVARDLSGRGCTVVVSNADHLSIRRLYKGFSMASIERNSVIAASSSFRSRITECLFYRRGVHQC